MIASDGKEMYKTNLLLFQRSPCLNRCRILKFISIWSGRKITYSKVQKRIGDIHDRGDASVFCFEWRLKALASALTSQTISTATEATQTTGCMAKKYFGNNSPLNNSRDVIVRTKQVVFLGLYWGLPWLCDQQSRERRLKLKENTDVEINPRNDIYPIMIHNRKTKESSRTIRIQSRVYSSGSGNFKRTQSANKSR